MTRDLNRIFGLDADGDITLEPGMEVVEIILPTDLSSRFVEACARQGDFPADVLCVWMHVYCEDAK